jgi:hypothetical protein
VNDLIPLGVLITIEPLPVIGFILVLSTDRGTRNGAAFIAAWVACIVGIIVATLALTGGEPVAPASAPATASYVVQLLLGVVLLGVAVERRLHPRPEPPPAPSWARRLDGMHAGGAALVGFLLQPWALVAAAAADVLQADLSKGATVAQLVVFSVVATSSLLAMQIYSMTNPERARATLDALRHWIDRHRNRAITGLAVVVGLWLATKGVLGLIGQS